MNSFLWLFLSMSALTPLPRQGEGELLFVYEPKHCLMPPCPQFRALEKDRQSIADAGFDIGFHFDPMMHVDGWQDMYSRAVKEVFASVPHNKIKWMSMGALRYQPQLKSIAMKRRPENTIFFDESVSGEDGKVRYLRQTRTEMFSFMNDLIKDLAPEVYTYLCMETKPVWEKSLGRLPDRAF